MSKILLLLLSIAILGDLTAPSLSNAAPAPDFGPYIEKLNQSIKKRWQPPTGRACMLVLVMRIAADGSLTSIKSVKSTMTPAEVASALKSLAAGGKFAPLPPNGPQSIQYEFTFEVQRGAPIASKSTTASVDKMLEKQPPSTAGATAFLPPPPQTAAPVTSTSALPNQPTPALPTHVDAMPAVPMAAVPTHVDPIPAISPHVDPMPAVPTHVDPIPAVPTHVDPTSAVSTHVDPMPAVSTQVDPIPALSTQVDPMHAVSTQVDPLHAVSTYAPTPTVRINRPVQIPTVRSIRVVRPQDAPPSRKADPNRDIVARPRSSLDSSSFLLSNGMPAVARANGAGNKESESDDDQQDTIKPTVRTITTKSDVPDLRGRDPQSIIAMATTAAKAGDNEKAVRTLSEGLKLNPSSYEMLMQLGSLHEDRRDFPRAAEQYEKAAPIPSDDPSAYLKLIRMYKETGDAENEARTWTAFGQKYPYKSLSLDVRKQVDAFKDKMADIKLKAEQGNPEQAQYRWPESMMPLKICIPANFDPPVAKLGGKEITGDEANTLIHEALDEWARASDGKLSFSYVAEEKDANLTFAWTTDQSNLHASGAIGVTHLGRTQRPIMLLAREYRDSRVPVSKETFFAVTLHEIGHALGLMHSPDTGDIMYPSAIHRPIRGLSKNDTARLRKLYGLE